MELETINKLYLELSQITTATTAREILLQKQLAEAQRDAERLDWIEKIALRELPSPPRSGMWKFGDVLIVGMSLRAAIDAAKGESNA